MRKIKHKERKAAGNMYCSFCRPDKVHAVYRKLGIFDPHNGFACEKHKDQIEEIPNSNDYSEGDYQSWMNL